MLEENFEKTFQAIHFILNKLSGSSDKLRVIKLAFLADKYSLLHLSRTITGDQYWAMPRGPAGTTTKNILDLDDDFIEDKAVAFLEEHFEYGSKGQVTIKKQVEYDLLSDTDMKSVELTLAKHKDKTTRELCDYTHLFPEWHMHEAKIFQLQKLGKPPAVKMKIEDLFSVPTKDFDTIPDRANTAKEIYLGL